MAKSLLTLFLLFITIPALGQQRSAKEIEKLFKSLSDTEAIMNGNSFQSGSINKTYLLSESTPDLNDIERKLLGEYKQVAFMCDFKSKPFFCYFVKDNEDKRGIIGLDGNVIAPPLSGNICNLPGGKDFGTLLIGEISKPTPAALLQEWTQVRANREFGAFFGLFSAIVIDANKSSIKSLLPKDEYIFLSLGYKGIGKYDIFTLKVVGDDALWGIVDMKGKEVLPNKYTGFIRKSNVLDTGNIGMWGKWVGTTEMDMSEALNYSKDLRAATQQRRQELAASLNSFGESMISTAQTIEDIQNASAGGSMQSTADVSGSRSAKSGSTGSNNNMSEQQSYNTDKATYGRYDSMLAQVFAGNRDASASEISNWQSQMKELRKKWESKGKPFPHSANEDRR